MDEGHDILKKWRPSCARGGPESVCTHGTRRILAELRLGTSVSCSRRRVLQLIRHMGLSGVHHRDRPTEIRADLPRRAGSIAHLSVSPCRSWGAEVTGHPAYERRPYPVAAAESEPRKAVSWAVDKHLKPKLVMDALQPAIRPRRSPRVSVIVSITSPNDAPRFAGHSCRIGSAFCRRRPARDALDHAKAESSFATFEIGLLDREAWLKPEALRTAYRADSSTRRPFMPEGSPRGFWRSARKNLKGGGLRRPVPFGSRSRNIGRSA